MEFQESGKEPNEKSDGLDDIHNQKLNLPSATNFGERQKKFLDIAASIMHEPKSLDDKRPRRSRPTFIANSCFSKALQGTGMREKKEGNIITIPQKSLKVADIPLASPEPKAPFKRSKPHGNNFELGKIVEVRHIAEPELSFKSSKPQGSSARLGAKQNGHQFPNSSTSFVNSNAQGLSSGVLRGAQPVSRKKLLEPSRFPDFTRQNNYNGVQIKGTGNRQVVPKQRDVIDYIDLDNEPEPTKRVHNMEDSQGRLICNLPTPQRAKSKSKLTPVKLKRSMEAEEKMEDSRKRVGEADETTEEVRKRIVEAEEKTKGVNKRSMEALEKMNDVIEVAVNTIFTANLETAKCLSIDYPKSKPLVKPLTLEIKEYSCSAKPRFVVEFNACYKGSLCEEINSSKSEKRTFDAATLSKATLSVPNESNEIVITGSDGDVGGLLSTRLESSEVVKEFVSLMEQHFEGLVIDGKFLNRGPINKEPQPAAVAAMDSSLLDVEIQDTAPRVDTPMPSPDRCIKKQRADEPSNLPELFQVTSPAEPRYQLRSKKPIVDSSTTASKMLLNYPTELGGTVIVHEIDRRRLGPKEFLNDVIIEFYLNHTLKRIGKKAPLQILSTFLYPQLLRVQNNPTEGFKRLDPWVKSSFFEQEFVLIPINEASHWYLVIIGRPNLLLKDKGKCKGPQRRSASLNPPVEPSSKQAQHNGAPVQPPSEPWIAILNSMETGSENVTGVFRDYVVHLAQRDLEIDPKWLRVWLFSTTYYAPVPQQKNGVDCGIFLLEFAETFMADPYCCERLIINSPPFPPRAPKGETKGVPPRERQLKWVPMDPSYKRKQIRCLIDSLAGQGTTKDKKKYEPTPPGSDVEIVECSDSEGIKV